MGLDANGLWRFWHRRVQPPPATDGEAPRTSSGAAATSPMWSGAPEDAGADAPAPAAGPTAADPPGRAAARSSVAAELELGAVARGKAGERRSVRFPADAAGSPRGERPSCVPLSERSSAVSERSTEYPEPTTAPTGVAGAVAAAGKRFLWAARRYVERNWIQIYAAVREFVTRFMKHLTSCLCCVAVLAAYRADLPWLAGFLSAPADCVMCLYLWQFFLTKEKAASRAAWLATACVTVGVTALKVASVLVPSVLVINLYAAGYYSALFVAAPCAVARDWRARTGNRATWVDRAAAVCVVVAITSHAFYVQVQLGVVKASCPKGLAPPSVGGCATLAVAGLAAFVFVVVVAAGGFNCPPTRGLSPEMLALACWVNQIVPVYMGDLLLTNVTQIANTSDLYVFLAVYYGAASLLLQVLRRLASASLGGHDDEAVQDVVTFPNLFAFDLFFNLIFISVEYPRPSFFALLLTQFVQIVVRDGDFQGLFEEHVLCPSCNRGDAFASELRRHWRILSINNPLSEVVATLAVFSSVAFDTLAFAGRSVITPAASPRKRSNILVGVALVFVVLKVAHRCTHAIWDARLNRLSRDVEASLETTAPNAAGVAMPTTTTTRPPPLQRTRTKRRGQLDRAVLRSSTARLNGFAVHCDSAESRTYYLQRHYPYFAAVLYYTICNALKVTVAINDYHAGRGSKADALAAGEDIR